MMRSFQHPDLQHFYERAMALKVVGMTDEERPVFALTDAYGWFRLIDGDQSPEVREIIKHLLSPELRPALRSWYRRHGTAHGNTVANEFCNRLSEVAGERFTDA